jgi:LCP family protein required for cell wall assembly
VDAQGRGGAGGGEVDPADQWVYNPDTGDYELRASGPQASHRSHGQQAHPTPRPASTASATPSRHDVPPRQRRGPQPTTDRPLPGQRDRRAPHSRRKPKAKKRRSGKKKALMWVGGSLAMVLLTGCALAGYMYWKLNQNLTSTEVVGEETGYEDGEPVNILFIGTDNRQGENSGYGNEGDSGRADTTVLMHFSAEREHATGLSIPRDLITDIPECEVQNEDGSTTVIPASEDIRFNESLGVGGRDPGCVWRTVEQITGVEIDHYIMADFNAVKDMSSAVGGVPVCLEEPIDDPKSHLQLDAGDHVLEGEDALAFVRTRYSVGTGSDLSRIELQQQFLASLAREINGIGVDTKLWDLADAATKALTVDNGIGTVRKLYDLQRDLSRVPMSDMSFLTVPVVDNTDGATVLVDEPNAEPIFQMLQQDVSMTGGDGKKGGGGNGGGNQQMAPPEDVRVDVYNGGDVLGAAQETVTWLQNEQGVPLSTNAGNAAEPQEKTTLEYGPDQADQAARLADMMGLKKSMLQQGTADAGDEPMVLILGNDFNGAGEPVGGPPRKPDGVESITADDEDVCAS